MEENKNLEDFIRRRLESSEYPYQESDWLLLEKRLDAAGMVPVASVFQNVKSVLLVLILVTLAFLGGWLLRGIFVPEEPVLSISESASQKAINPITNGSATDPNEIAEEECEEDEIIPNVSAGRNPGIATVADPLFTETSPKALDIKKTVESVIGPNRDEREFSTPYLSLMAGLEPSFGNDLNTGIMQRISEPYFEFLEEAEEEEAGKRSAWRNFAFGLSLSPDFNSVGFNRNGSVTVKPGLQIYYQISPKWVGSTGIFYNRKKYETNGEDYSPPQGYWIRRTKGVIPDQIFGSCSVIDVPVSLYYKWKDKERLTLSAGLGLNSYFLLDEDYVWTFDQPNPGAEDGWRTDKNSIAYGGLITFSVALGVKISKRSELVIEPYFKQPLRSVGWGNVEMYGTGTQFTFKFH